MYNIDGGKLHRQIMQAVRNCPNSSIREIYKQTDESRLDRVAKYISQLVVDGTLIRSGNDQYSVAE